MIEENENLISIEEVIERTKRLGVDFGKGDPRNRLRYYTKIGLLPLAKRRRFGNKFSQGAYPEDIVRLLFQIDREIKSGRSIQAIKKELKERKEKIFEAVPPPKIEIEKGIEEVPEEKPKLKIEAFNFFKTILIIFAILGIILFVRSKISDMLPYLFARIEGIRKLVQAPPVEVEKEILVSPPIEPYLTINAQTDINAPLNVKEKITAPGFVLVKDEFSGKISVVSLTADREYIFPDLSGTVCLTTGNCVGLAGEVISPGGTPNRLAKFISARGIGNSSISDLYAGIAIAINGAGNVGIGTVTPRTKLEVAGNLLTTGKVGIGIETPKYDLHVKGRIQATGDICTDIGGKCLSQLTAFPTFWGGGISGSGSTNYLPIWAGATSLGNSIVSQSGTTLDVAGTLKMTGFQLTTNATSGYILTSDASGVGTWQPSLGLPSGQSGQTLRHDGTSWVPNSFLYNTGSAIGIGTTTTLATLTLSGNAIFSTTTLPQLSLQYDGTNYLNFSASSTQSLIEASGNLVINSLTGQVLLGNDVANFYAPNATITGLTFISTTTDPTVRKSGELVFRSAIPIFRFPIAAQTTSTGYVIVSKIFSTTDSLSSITPPSLPGTNRKYAFLINFADDIATTSSSTWRVYRPAAATTTTTFEFQGQNLSSLDVGNPFSTNYLTLPDNDWRLEVALPSADKRIRIFNILLLAFDQLP